MGERNLSAGNNFGYFCEHRVIFYSILRAFQFQTNAIIKVQCCYGNLLEHSFSEVHRKSQGAKKAVNSYLLCTKSLIFSGI